MGLTLPTLASGSSGIGLGGAAIIGGAANFASQLFTNSANRGMARDQMAYQTQMSNTAHQREVKDLIKAGLNPILSAGGAGSSTPSGASADMKAPQIDMPAIMQAMSLKQDQQRIDIEKQNSAANIAKNLTEQDLNKMKKILMQKGMIRANLEGEISSGISNLFKKAKSTPDILKSIQPTSMGSPYPRR